MPGPASGGGAAATAAVAGSIDTTPSAMSAAAMLFRIEFISKSP
jgi:hypothetical protein